MKLPFVEGALAKLLYPTGNCMVHVGKCGGSTIKYVLRGNGKEDDYTIAHTFPIFFSKNINYYLQLRHPIERLISAYNWRHTRLIIDGDQRKDDYGEYDTLKAYENLDEIARALYTNGQENKRVVKQLNRVRHVRKGIHFHINNLVKYDQARDAIKGVFCQETLSDDVMRILGHEIEIHRNVNSRAVLPKDISAEARQNLMRYAAKEYETLKTLYDWGLLPEKQYEYYLT